MSSIALQHQLRIPVIGGKDLDLHRLFIEVSSRRGIARVLNVKRWKEVTSIFNFPSSATNASFVLRKYYFSLLQHYEQIYYFKAKGWTESVDSLPKAPPLLASNHPLDASVLPLTHVQEDPLQPQRNPAVSLSRGDTSHVDSWLIGRHVNATKVKKNTKQIDPSKFDDYVNNLTTNIQVQLKAEMEENVKQENLAFVLNKLGEANPKLKVNLQEVLGNRSGSSCNNQNISSLNL